MSIGDGIFWVGLFYCVAQLFEYIIAVLALKLFPNKHVQRLDRIEKVIAEMGVELDK